MKTRVTVVDYGIGNVYSVQRAFEVCGAQVVLSADPREIEAADRLVLPGVGAFAEGMTGLRERALIDPIRRYAATGRPLLGICLGMQMLATISREFGEHSGLGLISGAVLPLPGTDHFGHPLKIPHTGWTGLFRTDTSSWLNSPLENTIEGESVYMVHSFAFNPEDDRDRLADCIYGGHRVCAAVRRNRVFGCQFHPEKSGPAGLRMLSRFLAC